MYYTTLELEYPQFLGADSVPRFARMEEELVWWDSRELAERYAQGTTYIVIQRDNLPQV